jgi:hypothetical protein
VLLSCGREFQFFGPDPSPLELACIDSIRHLIKFNKEYQVKTL